MLAHAPLSGDRAMAVPAWTSTRSPGAHGVDHATCRPSRCPVAVRTVVEPLPSVRDDLAEASFVGARDAHLVGARGVVAGREQARMLEAHVGELPQHVVQQHEAAVVHGVAVVARRRSRTWSAAPGGGRGPSPIQRSSAPHAPGPPQHAAAPTSSSAVLIASDDVAGAHERTQLGDGVGLVDATAGSARLPTITGCTNSTATWRACSGAAGATHHMVAPAWNRRARCSAAIANGSPASASLPTRSSATGSTIAPLAVTSGRPRQRPSLGTVRPFGAQRQAIDRRSSEPTRSGVGSLG